MEMDTQGLILCVRVCVCVSLQSSHIEMVHDGVNPQCARVCVCGEGGMGVGGVSG